VRGLCALLPARTLVRISQPCMRFTIFFSTHRQLLSQLLPRVSHRLTISVLILPCHTFASTNCQRNGDILDSCSNFFFPVSMKLEVNKNSPILSCFEYTDAQKKHEELVLAKKYERQ
jgi:glutathione peroxidase-family protein